MPVVHLEGAITLLGRFPALAGVDLAVDEGEVVLLEGHNGAGKTTLLRLCAGLAPLNGGSGTVLGNDLSTRPGRRATRRSVGLLGHQVALYDELTVEQNLWFWSRANRSREVDVESALERLGLAGRLRQVPVRSLSAGQRRRVALALIVSRRARLWLLDEPHSGLDPDGRDEIDGLVTAAADAGATVIFSSHESERARSLASRSVRIAGGTAQPDPAEQAEADHR